MVEADVRRNEEVWKTLYSEGKNDLRYPNEVLVRVGLRLLDPHQHRRILDFGFGTGGNVQHFASLGYELSGVEISEHAIAKAELRLSASGLKADLRRYNPEDPLPFEDGYFDTVIAWQVLYYNTWESLAKTVQEIERVLRPGGLAIAAFAAPGDISHQMADSLGDCLYRSRVPGQEGCVMVIPDEPQIHRFFPGRKIEVGEFGHRFSGQAVRHWVVVYRKD